MQVEGECCIMAENKRAIPFSPPDVSELEVAEVAEALRSGWITTGPRTKQLEKNIAQWIGTEKCVHVILRRAKAAWCIPAGDC